jgi:uridylate kinase
MATRLNAELVRAIFSEHAYERVAVNPTKKVDTDKRIIVGCGWQPGCSSDMDAVLFAKNVKADTLVNLSNIEYVYDKDPNKFKDARKLEIIFRRLFGLMVT